MEVDDVKQEDLEVKEEEVKEEKVEEEEVTEEEKVEEEEAPPEDEEIPEEFHTRPSTQEINKEFPTLFKTFPELRHMYFREQEFSELFPTVEEAKDAKERLEGIQNLEENITSGKVEGVESTLSAIKEMGEGTLSNFATNLLPALQKVDQDAYYRVITPEIVGMIRSLYNAGAKLPGDAGENYKNAALVASLFFFEDMDYASGKKQLNLPKAVVKEVEKDNEIEKERAQFKFERYEALMADVNADYQAEISREIQRELDPDEVMTPYMKSVLTKDIIERINKALSSDRDHAAKMKILWGKAANSNFSSSWKRQIITAALSRAKAVMPTIRNKARAEALGVQEKSSKRLEKVTSPKAIGQSTSNGGGGTKINISKIDPKKIDPSVSDLDILQGKIKLKG